MDLTLSTKELHILWLAIKHRVETLPDQTPEELRIGRDLEEKVHKAYVDSDYLDFEKERKGDLDHEKR